MSPWIERRCPGLEDSVEQIEGREAEARWSVWFNGLMILLVERSFYGVGLRI